MAQVGHAMMVNRRGSALILTVVLTSLLAIVGVLFMMATRIDKMATSAAAESRQIDFAVEAVLSQIDEALIADIPGTTDDEEYYDYPDPNNVWLADLEPYQSGGSYYWRQISNIAGVALGDTSDILIRVVGERDPIDPNVNVDPGRTTADADGDGVGDARWFRVPGVMSSKGKPIYAAVRVIDNGGMLNVNTGFKFDEQLNNQAQIDGCSQLQVNVLALAAAPGTAPTAANEAALLGARATNPVAALDLAGYEREIIWRYLEPDPEPNLPYTFFDVSDELELRYRYLLNHGDIDTRVENWGWFKAPSYLRTPVDQTAELSTWFPRAGGGLSVASELLGVDSRYAYRHVATTYNADRIILPKLLQTAAGARLGKMVNVNTADAYTLRDAIMAALTEVDPNLYLGERATQIAANLRDFIDDDDEVTVMPGTQTSSFYGFERPSICLSELACRLVEDPDTGRIHKSFAIELYKPYFEDRDPRADEWKLIINNALLGTVEREITWSGTRRFHVLLVEDPLAPLKEDYLLFSDPQEPADTMPLYGYQRSGYASASQDLDPIGFEEGATIILQRKASATGTWFTVDFVRVPAGWMLVDGTARSITRDISPHKWVRRLWASVGATSTPGLGNASSHYVDTTRPEVIQAHPANRPLTNIGELGMIFARSGYNMAEGTVAADVMVDLQHPAFARLFNYLTVIEPAQFGRDAAETRVMGRININTAPWFVLAQLPWIQHKDGKPFEKARAIVQYRDLKKGYRSIGELNQIPLLHVLASDNEDNQYSGAPQGPDITPDTARDDFEERDLIFTRISNLVTVRSDVFTAYIVVRVGTEGPQKRAVAVLDRSRVGASGGNIRLVAQQFVPDPR